VNPSATIFDRGLAAAGHAVLDELLARSYVLLEDWKATPPEIQAQILHTAERSTVLQLLAEHRLLTRYQASRIEAGTTHGLILGNYRVLERLGAGGMAVVFKAEHIEMRHQVAIKVLPMGLGQDQRLRSRFTAEMRVVARLRHPNIVAALDAGQVVSDDPDTPVLWYLVMEYVAGQDLEEYVVRRGPLPVQKACNLIYQMAGALEEIHKYRLVHRDIKPSNIMVTAEDQAKLLDFGLSRQLDAQAQARVTQPGALLGTLDFMAPEQARDARSVDIRADIYALGGTLFWCLTGQLPFPPRTSGPDRSDRRRSLPAASLLAPGVPAEMEQVLARMTAFEPQNRYPDPQAVLHALVPFLKNGSQTLFPLESAPQLGVERVPASDGGVLAPTERAVLIVDDDDGVRDYCRLALEGEGLRCDVVADGASALAALETRLYDLVLLDVCLPDVTGPELLERLRKAPPWPNLKVIMMSGMATPEEMGRMLTAGADDFIVKPPCLTSFRGRVRAALRLKEAQDRSDRLNRRLLQVNEELEHNLGARDEDVAAARHALVRSLSRLLELRDPQAGTRLQRLRRYSRALAEATAREHAYSAQVDASFIEMLECAAGLYDVGKVTLPDHILLNPGKLSEEERIVMQTHTTVGAETLAEIAQHHSSSLAFLKLAADVARSHHERWDGSGYPERLRGDDIPLAARLMALCDVYDALRSRRLHKPALSHESALTVMQHCCAGQFDPALLTIFASCADQFARIFADFPDRR
jgi:response regulator RpfG family c-di-GMP phosphodiesterase/serine/threonine protein kinase